MVQFFPSGSAHCSGNLLVPNDGDMLDFRIVSGMYRPNLVDWPLTTCDEHYKYIDPHDSVLMVFRHTDYTIQHYRGTDGYFLIEYDLSYSKPASPFPPNVETIVEDSYGNAVLFGTAYNYDPTTGSITGDKKTRVYATFARGDFPIYVAEIDMEDWLAAQLDVPTRTFRVYRIRDNAREELFRFTFTVGVIECGDVYDSEILGAFVRTAALGWSDVAPAHAIDYISFY